MAAFPSWIEDPDSWDRVGLADFWLPGICTVSGLEISRAVDIKKTKGSDGATLTDNGIDPATFQIEVRLTANEWPLWLAILPKIHPRRAGGTREPQKITHPEPNHVGIENVYIRKIRTSPPSPRSGRTVILDVVEWFPAPKKAKAKSAPRPNPNQKYFGDPRALERDLAGTSTPLPTAAGQQPLPPDDPTNIAANLF